MPIALATVFFIFAYAGTGQSGPGGKMGRLAGCPTPNCVSSQAPQPGVGGRLQEIIIGGRELGPATLANF